MTSLQPYLLPSLLTHFTAQTSNTKELDVLKKGFIAIWVILNR